MGFYEFKWMQLRPKFLQGSNLPELTTPRSGWFFVARCLLSPSVRMEGFLKSESRAIWG